MKLTKYYKIKIITIAILLSIDILCFTTEFENRIKERINISEGFMKHKKIQAQNLNAMYKTIDSSNLIKSKANGLNKITTQNNGSLNPSKNLGISNANEVLNLSDKQEPEAIDTEIGNGPIYASGWIKYFKFTPTSDMLNKSLGKNPRSFIVNGQFKEQAKLFPNINLEIKTSDGINENYLHIKNKFSFYAVLLKNNLNILTSRKTQIQQTFDNINVSNLKNVVEAGGFSKGSGIEDFGNFSEGFCFKLNVASTLETYVICCDDQKTKLNFMTYIKKMKIKLQRDGGIVLTPRIKEEKDDLTIAGMLNPSKIDTNKSASLSKDSNGNLSVKMDPKKSNIFDGYWIVLQNWSQCTLKCGGGKSYLQRMCVPPKNGGKPCVGEAILTKDCNMHACPKVSKSQELLKKSNNTQILKPLVKIMPFSSRPQRYSKCVIKEGDLLYNKDIAEKDPLLSQTGGEKPAEIENVKIPVRLVMNNRTVTIFAGEDYDSHIETFILKKAKLYRDAKSEECFIIKEETGERQAHLCAFGDGKRIIEEWNYDFNLFKYQCNFKKQEYIMDEFQKKLEEKIKDVKKGLLDEVQEKNKIKAQETEEMKLESKVKKTNKVALQAIQKELNLEELIKQEEAERERREEQQMIKKIEEEKKKSECLMKAIKEKQLENQYNLRQKETLEAISNIRHAAIKEVQTRRNNLKKIIEEMRQKQKRKTNGLSQKLQSVRYEMAQQMGKAYKKGDAGNCQKIGFGTESKEKKQMRKNYCVANYSEDFVKYQDCLEGDDFCHMCCDSEFGEFYVGERETCYKAACKKNTDPEPEKQDSGRWIWQTEIAEGN